MTAPKVEQATKMGMIQAILPYSLLANVTATASEPSTSGTMKETLLNFSQPNIC